MVFKLKIKSIVTVLIFACMVTTYAQTYKQKARSSLQKWGIAYCISKIHPKSSIDTISSYAQGAYFEEGYHNYSAYVKIQKFVDEYVKETYQGKHNQDLSLMKCLDLIDDKTFMATVKYCDKWLIRK